MLIADGNLLDITLGSGTNELHVPKGTSLWIPVLAIHHDEAVGGADARDDTSSCRTGSRPGARGRGRGGSCRSHRLPHLRIRIHDLLLASFCFGILTRHRGK